MKKQTWALVICFLFILTNLGFSEIKGKLTATDDNGNALEIIYYDNDKEIAKKTFDQNGNSKTTGKIPDGPVSLHDRDGNLISEYFVKNNKANGESKDFYKNGSVEYLSSYKNGVINGLAKGFYENGNLKSETDYLNGMMQGYHRGFNEEGDLIKDETYRSDMRTSSKVYEYYSAGKHKLSMALILDKKGDVVSQGYTKGYEEDGNIAFEVAGYDSAGELHGKFKRYKNGNVIQEGIYAHGKEDGLWKQYWEETGFMAYKILYKNGEKLSQEAYNVNGKLLGKQIF